MSLLTELEDVTGVGVCYKHVASYGAFKALRPFNYGFSKRKYLLAPVAFTFTR